MMIRLLITAVLLAIIISAHAQDNSWVDQLRSEDGRVCCFNNDGRRLDDPEWRTAGDGYEVLFTEGWVRIPDGAVVSMRNQDGIARVWSHMANDTRAVVCFLPGSFS